MAVPPLVAHVVHQPTPDLLYLSASEASSELIHHVGHGRERRHPRQVLEEASVQPPSTRSRPSHASPTRRWLPPQNHHRHARRPLPRRMHARKQARFLRRGCSLLRGPATLYGGDIRCRLTCVGDELRATASPSRPCIPPSVGRSRNSPARCAPLHGVLCRQAAFMGCTLP